MQLGLDSPAITQRLVFSPQRILSIPGTATPTAATRFTPVTEHKLVFKKRRYLQQTMFVYSLASLDVNVDNNCRSISVGDSGKKKSVNKQDFSNIK